MDCSNCWRASICRGSWSVVLNVSATGLPLAKYDCAGGCKNGQRYIQYSPPKGMLSGLVEPANDPFPVGRGAMSRGTGRISGHKMTPGSPPLATATAGEGGFAGCAAGWFLYSNSRRTARAVSRGPPPGPKPPEPWNSRTASPPTVKPAASNTVAATRTIALGRVGGGPGCHAPTERASTVSMAALMTSNPAAVRG